MCKWVCKQLCLLLLFLCSFGFSQAIDDPFVEDKNKKSLKCVDLTCYDKTQSKIHASNFDKM